MKNYKNLVPIVLIVLFFASIYMLYDVKSSELKQYEQYITSARDYRSQDIRVDAEANYKSALSMKPSLELYLEIGEFYKETEQTKQAIGWGSIILNEYPKSVEGYEFLIELYNARNDYVGCFELVDTMQKRRLTSKIVDEVINKIEYEFFFNGEYENVGIYSDNLCPVLIGDKWGYVNLKGDKVIANKFVKMGYHIGGLAPVVDDSGSAYFIDANGNKKMVVRDVENIKELGLIDNKLFSLFNGKTWGFYNEKGKHIFGEYNDVSSIVNGIAAVSNGSTWTLVNRDGKDLTGSSYDGVAMDEKKVVYRNERIFTYDNLAYHLIDSSGKTISEQTYEDVHIFNDLTYAAVKIKGFWGFVDKDGKIVIEPQYEDARSFSNGLAAVKLAGKWGYIDETGKMVIEPQFDDAKDFNSNGAVFVLNNKTWRLLRLYKYNH